MKLTSRRYHDDTDYWKARAFLREVFLLNGRRMLSWDVCRWDYWRWHVSENLERFNTAEAVFFWETPDGQIAAILNPEGPGEVNLQVHPNLREPGLEEEMVATAEQYLAISDGKGRQRLRVWAIECDQARQELLARRGYVKSDWPEYMHYQSLEGPVLDAKPAPGYTVRALGDGLELLERCYASGLGFHKGDIKIAVENRDDATWYRNIQNAPLYRRDLDIVAIAPDGAIASFCTVWFDDVSRIGIFEPVATVPAHQRRGLGKAVMSEGLRRLVKMGAIKAFVSSYSVEAGALYASTGFSAYELNEPWMKVL